MAVSANDNAPSQAPPLVVLVGPTAAGKTGVAIHLARKFDAEIVSADSVQVYRLLDIGSAKPTPGEQGRAKHHLIDVLWPDQDFSAADFAAEADEIIADVHRRQKRIIIAGGTGLYVKALLEGLFEMEPELTAKAKEVRARLLNEEAASPGALYSRLRTIDPEAAERISPQDIVRTSRALEVYEVTGRPISELHHASGQKPRYPHLMIGLDRPRDELYQRIEERCDRMLRLGLFGEMRRILSFGYSPELKPLRSLGYRHVGDLLAGRVGRAEMRRLFIRDTRHYAKRQLTWYNKNSTIWWRHPADLKQIEARVADFWS